MLGQFRENFVADRTSLALRDALASDNAKGLDDEWFQVAHVTRRSAPNAGHFPWIENPQAVAAAFAASLSL